MCHEDVKHWPAASLFKVACRVNCLPCIIGLCHYYSIPPFDWHVPNLLIHQSLTSADLCHFRQGTVLIGCGQPTLPPLPAASTQGAGLYPNRQPLHTFTIMNAPLWWSGVGNESACLSGVKGYMFWCQGGLGFRNVSGVAASTERHQTDRRSLTMEPARFLC